MTPLILYIPGLLPKPEAEIHKAALLRCLLAGVNKVDPDIAAQIEAEHGFDIVSWTYNFYRQHRDIGLDMAGIEAVLEQPAPSEDDIREASGWRRRVSIWIYQFGDYLPFLIPHLATEKMEVHLTDLRRYLKNRDGISDQTREMLKTPLRAAAASGRPILLLAHSMGSIIAYDALWELTHVNHDAVRIDQFLTMGSPLGQNFIQKRIFGRDRRGNDRYPHNIRRWKNLSAVGELTAIDRVLANDFAQMLSLGLVASIDDMDLYNSFRLNGRLNVHAEYGYLVSDVTGRAIAEWWREATTSQVPA